jgi:hypothetical protein
MALPSVIGILDMRSSGARALGSQGVAMDSILRGDVSRATVAETPPLRCAMELSGNRAVTIDGGIGL